MATNPTHEFKKLNTLLSNSFDNIKHDVRDLNSRMDSLQSHINRLCTDSLHNELATQQKIFIEQQQNLNLISERLSKLEDKRQQRQTFQLDTAEQTRKFSAGSIDPARTAIKTAEDEQESIYNISDGEVRITKVNFKSPGGRKNLNGEWIEITGYGGIDLTGYVLHDKGKKHKFAFPKGFKIYGPTRVFTGKGKNTNTKLYWKMHRPVWNDEHDVATLRDNKGNVVSQVASELVHDFKILK